MRRSLLVLFVGFAVLASGCAGDSTSPETPNNTDNSPDNSTETSSADSSDSDDGLDKPDVHTVALTADKNRVKVGNNVTLRATVENTGDIAGDYKESIGVARETFDYENFESVATVETDEVNAGGQTEISTTFRMGSIATYKYRINEFSGGEFNTTVEVVPRNLSLGESYTNARPVKMTVENFELVDSYESGSGGEVTPESESTQFLFMKYRAENTGDENVTSTDFHELDVLTGGEQFSETSNDEDAANYKAFQKDHDGFYNPLEPGEVREGYLSYRVPGDASREDITFRWNGDIGVQAPVVYWHR